MINREVLAVRSWGRATPDLYESKGGLNLASPYKTPPGDVPTGVNSVKSSTAHPSNEKYSHHHGTVGDANYKQQFINYNPPPASTVYYPVNSLIYYLPWLYLFSQNSPIRQDAVVIEPDGREVIAVPERSHLDGYMIFSWVSVLILLILAIILILKLVKKWCVWRLEKH